MRRTANSSYLQSNSKDADSLGSDECSIMKPSHFNYLQSNGKDADALGSYKFGLDWSLIDQIHQTTPWL